MKGISIKLPDELALKLGTLAKELKISEEEIIARSLEEYLAKLEKMDELEPIGFGMWKDREGMKDPAAWVRSLRETELGEVDRVALSVPMAYNFR